MALAHDAPKDGFRLSMLIYDTRFRSFTIQVIVLILVLLGIAWLVDNTIANLAAKDKDINFGFLWNRAGYDIEQQLIPYTNDSSHGRAAIIGLLNTLVVAFWGCIFATIIGVFAGVLRLSKNWLVGRLMTVYVEAFRNVPLLLWIIVVFVVTSETAPQPKDFKVTAEMVQIGEFIARVLASPDDDRTHAAVRAEVEVTAAMDAEVLHALEEETHAEVDQEQEEYAY